MRGKGWSYTQIEGRGGWKKRRSRWLDLSNNRVGDRRGGLDALAPVAQRDGVGGLSDGLGVGGRGQRGRAHWRPGFSLEAAHVVLVHERAQVLQYHKKITLIKKKIKFSSCVNSKRIGCKVKYD
jgi:hypothetical protein